MLSIDERDEITRLERAMRTSTPRQAEAIDRRLRELYGRANEGEAQQGWMMDPNDCDYH